MSPATLLLVGLIVIWLFESGRISAVAAVLMH